MPRHIDRKCAELRGFIAEAVFAALSPEARSLSYEVLFRLSQDAANSIVRHALDPKQPLALPPFVEIPEGLLEEVSSSLVKLKPVEEEFWSFWYRSPVLRPYRLEYSPQRRGQRRRRGQLLLDEGTEEPDKLGAAVESLVSGRARFEVGGLRQRESAADENDVSWILNSGWSRDEILENTMFLRGFESYEELSSAAHQHFLHWSPRGNRRGDTDPLESHQELVFPNLVPAQCTDLDFLDDEQFEKFVNSLVRFRPAAPTERITNYDDWTLFVTGFGSEEPDGDAGYRARKKLLDHVTPEMLDGGIAMWVRTFLHVGIITSSSCSGHCNHEAYIRFASPYDSVLAKWVLLLVGVSDDFHFRGHLRIDSKSLFSQQHFELAKKIRERKSEIAQLRHEMTRRVQSQEFTRWEPLDSDARASLLDGEMARHFDTPPLFALQTHER